MSGLSDEFLNCLNSFYYILYPFLYFICEALVILKPNCMRKLQGFF